MDPEEEISIGRTLMLLGLVWIFAGFVIGSAFWDIEVAVGLTLGGILPLITGIGIFRRGKRKVSNTD